MKQTRPRSEASMKQDIITTPQQEWKVAYVVSRYTNENSNYKRHIIDEQGIPLCMSHTRSFSLEYTNEQANCKRCWQIEKKMFLR